MKRILVIGLIAALTGCGTTHNNPALEKAIVDARTQIEKSKKAELDYINKKHEIRIRSEREAEQDKKSLREKGYVVCEKYSTYSACK